jgi:hypothetical protein
MKIVAWMLRTIGFALILIGCGFGLNGIYTFAEYNQKLVEQLETNVNHQINPAKMKKDVTVDLSVAVCLLIAGKFVRALGKLCLGRVRGQDRVQKAQRNIYPTVFFVLPGNGGRDIKVTRTVSRVTSPPPLK